VGQHNVSSRRLVTGWTSALTIAAVAYFVGAFDPAELTAVTTRDAYIRHLASIDMTSLGRTVEPRLIPRNDDRVIDLVPVPDLDRSFDAASSPEVAAPTRHTRGLPSVIPQRGPPALTASY
jgi:hypothetical protein